METVFPLTNFYHELKSLHYRIVDTELTTLLHIFVYKHVKWIS